MLTRRTGPALGPLLVALAATCFGASASAQIPGKTAAPAAIPSTALPAPESTAAEAAAAPSDETQMRSLDDEARERFELGRTFYDAGRFQQAAEEFGEAYKLSGRPQLLYNVYVANREAANWDPAIAALRDYLDKVPDAPDRINLRARLTTLEAQAAMQHEQQARLEAEQKRNARPTSRIEKHTSIVPWVLTGTGGALLVGSLVTGLMAKGKADDLKNECADGGKVCPQWRKDDANSTRTLAITTDVLWSVGAATALTGIVLWWTGALDTEHEVPIALGASPRGVSSSYTVRF